MKIHSIHLIGSRARGDARPDSDYDFMIYSDLRTKARYWSAIRFPPNLPSQVVEKIRNSCPADARIDIFLQYQWGESDGHAILYSKTGELVWDYAHDCPGGWISWKGAFSNAPSKS